MSLAKWFAEEVQPHDSQLKSYLRGSFPAVRDVDDVVQESFLRIWRARAAAPIASARGFLFRIARNLALDLIRRERVSPITAVTDSAAQSVVDDRPDAAETAAVRQELLLLAEAIDALPARCREIVILRKLQGVPQKAIAAQLGLSEQTVQVQVLRGVKRCEKFLRQHGVRR